MLKLGAMCPSFIIKSNRSLSRSGYEVIFKLCVMRCLIHYESLLTSHETMIAAAERHKVSGALGASGGPGAVVMCDTVDILPTCVRGLADDNE